MTIKLAISSFVFELDTAGYLRINSREWLFGRMAQTV